MTFCTFVLFTGATKAEASCHHCKSSRSSFGVSFGSSYVRQDPVVVRRYITQPTQVVYAAPIVTPVYYQPAYPVMIAPSPIYMEEVYVAPRAPRAFSGLSFSWNFFK